MPPPHSDLPIIRLDLPKKTEREKYGGLFYLGIGGLVVLVLLIARFGYGVWSLREVGSRIYVLHDSSQSDADRIRAAHALARDHRVTQTQYMDICMRRDLPGLARYLIAESLTWEAMADDPRAYAAAVAHSEGWPGWLRLLLVRPLAFGAASGIELPHEPLEHLSRNSDRMIVLWACYARAASWNDTEAEQTLKQEASGAGACRELAELLLAALAKKDSARFSALDRATRWLRNHHPDAMVLWKGWKEQGDQLVEENGPRNP